MTDSSSNEKRGWFQRLKDGLSRSSTKLTDSITGIFTKRKLDRAMLDELEEALIAADLGPATAIKLTKALAKDRFDKEVTSRKCVVSLPTRSPRCWILSPSRWCSANKPHVVLVVGVNGSGKTTTIGKLARLYQGQGKKVMLASCDTFRAAAVEQPKIRGERAQVPRILAAKVLILRALPSTRWTEGRRKTSISSSSMRRAGYETRRKLMEELAKIVPC